MLSSSVSSCCWALSIADWSALIVVVGWPGRLVVGELLLRLGQRGLRLGQLQLVLLIRGRRLRVRGLDLEVEGVERLLRLVDRRLVGHEHAGVRSRTRRAIGHELLLGARQGRLGLLQLQLVLLAGDAVRGRGPGDLEVERVELLLGLVDRRLVGLDRRVGRAGRLVVGELLLGVREGGLGLAQLELVLVGGLHLALLRHGQLLLGLPDRVIGCGPLGAGQPRLVDGQASLGDGQVGLGQVERRFRAGGVRGRQDVALGHPVPDADGDVLDQPAGR